MVASDESTAAVYQAMAEDPNSELNQLRREVRRLQGELRSTQLTIAAQADELIDLRQENDTLETRLASERSRVRNTMAAAEALVMNLRRLESEELDDYGGGSYGDTRDDRIPTVASIDSAHDGDTPAGGGMESERVGLSNAPAAPVVGEGLGKESVDVRTGHRYGLEGLTSRPGPGGVGEERVLSKASKVAPLGLQKSGLFAAAFSPSQSPKSSPSASPASPGATVAARPASAASASLPVAGPPPLTLASAAGVTDSHSHALRRGEGATSPSQGREAFPGLASLNLSYTCSTAHEGDIMCATASVDGNLVATGGDDRTTFLFDLGTRKSCGRLADSNRAVTALAFEAGGQFLAGGSHDGFLRFWRKGDGSRRKGRWVQESVLPGHSGRVSKLLFDAGAAADGPRLFSCSVDRAIKLTDCSVGKRPYVASTPSAIFDMDVQDGAHHVISGHKDGGLRIWDVAENGKAPASSSKVHDRAITSVCCLGDGFGVLTLGREGLLKLSDVRQLDQPVREMEGTVKVVSDWHRATLNGRVVACGLGPSGTVAHWNVDSGKILPRKLAAAAPPASGNDVLELLKRNPGAVIQPLWTPQCLVLAHKTSQLTVWQ